MALNASHLCPQAYNQTRDFMMRAFDLTEDQAITAITALVDFSITQVVDGNYGTNMGLPVFCAPLSTCRRAVHSGQSTFVVPDLHMYLKFMYCDDPHVTQLWKQQSAWFLFLQTTAAPTSGCQMCGISMCSFTQSFAAGWCSCMPS